MEEVRSHVAALREMLGAHRGPGPAPPGQGALQVATGGAAGGGGRTAGGGSVGSMCVRPHGRPRARGRARVPCPRCPRDLGIPSSPTAPSPGSLDHGTAGARLRCSPAGAVCLHFLDVRQWNVAAPPPPAA